MTKIMKISQKFMKNRYPIVGFKKNLGKFIFRNQTHSNQDNDNNPGTSTTPYIPNYNTNRFSFFLIENLKFGKNLFEVGARVDYEDYNVRGREVSQNIFRDEHSLNNITFSLGYEKNINEKFS